MYRAQVARATALVLILVIAMSLYSTSLLTASAQSGGLDDALQRARAAGSYRFTADIEQRLLPRAVATMIGQGDQQLTWHLEGDVQGRDRSRLEISLAGGLGERRAATLIQDGAKTFLQRGDRLEEVSNPFSLGTPTSDYLAFVGAAGNVRPLEAVQAGGESFTRFAFDIDGPQMAVDMLHEMERQLQGQLPAGIRLQPPQNLQRLTGRGEIWVDSRGLPRRQIMDLTMPEVDANYSGETHLIIDFFGFGAADLVPGVVPGPDGGWQLQPATPAVPADVSAGPAAWPHVQSAMLSPTWLAIFLLLLLGIGFVRLYQRSPRRAYALVAVIVIVALTAGPILQVLDVVRFGERTANAASAEPVANALGLKLAASDAESEKPAVSVAAEKAMTELMRGQTRALPGGLLAAAPQTDPTVDPLFVACGVGSSTVDSDDDDLTDFVENCYGTNYLLADSDYDLIPDGVELAGFQHASRTWYGNPLTGDSNGDGLPDSNEWPAPHGTAPSVDVDGDGIPNIWDGDSDGDGVPDGDDISPFVVTTAKPAMTLNIADDGSDVFRTIELQIQPENPAHLRYTLTQLDWPYDEQGQMRDLNNSTDDIRLVPFLEIETSVAPTQDLLDRYGAFYFEKTVDVNNTFQPGCILGQTCASGSTTYTKRTLMAPLFPQGSGAITNFFAKVAYQPGSGSIDWANARLVWLVAGQVDSHYQCGQAQPCVSTDVKVLQQYYEPFRISGFRINKSGEHEMVLFGTPNSPTEDKSLLNLMYGMEGTLLEAERMEGQPEGRTALGEIVNRFEQPSTPIELKWGVTEEVVTSHQVYAHADQLYAGGVDQARSFLGSHFSGASCTDHTGSQFSCASVLFALETHQGSLELGRINQINGTPPVSSNAVFTIPDENGSDGRVMLRQELLEANNVRVNLGDVPLARERSLRLQMYDRAGGAWEAATPARMMELVEFRYGSQWDDMLAQMLQLYPNLDETDMRLGAYISYLVANAGMARTIDINGANLVSELSNDLVFYSTQLALATAFNYTPSFALSASGIASGLFAYKAHAPHTIELRGADGGLDAQGVPAGTFPETLTSVGADSLIARLQAIKSWEGGRAANNVKAGISTALLVTQMGLVGIGMAMQVANAVCTGLQDKCDAKALEIANIVVGAVSQVGLLIQVGQAVVTAIKISNEVANVAKITATGTAVAFAVAFIFFAIQVILIWVTYALIVNNTDSNLAKAQAYGQAVAATYTAGIFFLISVFVSILALFLSLLGPIGIIIGVAIGILIGLFFLIDFIIGATGHDSLTAKFAAEIAKAFTDIEILQEPKDAYFEGTRLSLSSFGDLMRADGFVAGSRLTFSDRYHGLFEGGEYSAGEYDDWEGSVAPATWATFTPIGTANVISIGKNEAPACGPKTTYLGSPGSITISSSDSSEWACENAAGVEFRFDQPVLNAAVKYKVEIVFEFWFEKCEKNAAPLPGLRPERFENETCDVDVERRVLPQDGEDLHEEDWQVTAYYDIFPATLDELWTWNQVWNPDRDGDGLKAFTYPNTTTVYEPPYNTDPNNWDSDGDGLPDGYEANNSARFGLNPLVADADGDGLSDSLEHRLGTRPNNDDSDGDGVPDGEEVFHYNAQWQGGWMVNIPGDAPLMSFPDPLVADADGDAQSDAMEKQNHISPYAINDAPAVLAEVEPLAVAPDGRQGAFVQPGDAVDLGLGVFNVGSQAVTTTLELCLPTLLVNVQGGQMTGSRNPPTQTGVCTNGGNRRAWTFGPQPGNPAINHKLQIGDSVATTFSTTANPALPASAIGDITYSLPYRDRLLAGRTRVYVDNDDPEAAFSAPPDGSFLRGTSYVVGGGAKDPTSWVTRVMLDLGTGSWQQLDDTGPWAYTWTLPPDGVYTLQAQAFDYFDRDSAIAQSTVTVDNTPPSAGHSLPNGTILTSTGGVVALSGPASDNLSGLERVQLSVDDKPWQEVDFSGQGGGPLNSTWQYDSPIGVNAQGSHTILVRAYDRAGNASDATAIEVIIDTLPPTDDLTRRLSADTFTLVPASPNVSFAGRANDAGRAPLPPRPSPLAGEMDAISNATVWLEPYSIFEGDGGQTFTWLGDVDGDGLGDLAVGFPAAAGGRGAIYVVYGKAGDWKVPSDVEALIDSGAVFYGVEDAGIGQHVMAAGDVDRDGLSDFLIGDAANNRAYLILGRTAHFGRQDLGDLPTVAQAMFVVPPGVGLGGVSVSAGDVNGDGYADVLLGSDNEALLLLGTSDWHAQMVDADSAAAARIVLPSGGFAVGVGDVDDNQRDEIVVTAPGGGVYLLAIPTGLSAGDNLVINPTSTNLAFLPGGWTDAVALGDVNGDGIDDFVYGGGGATPRLVYGRTGGAWGVSVHFDGLSPAATGFVAAPGDVNGDGRSDLLLGAAGDRAYLVLGSSGLNSGGPVQATLMGVAGAASTPFASGADVNCDFSSELLLQPAESGFLAGLQDYGEPATVDMTSLPVAHPANAQPVRSDNLPENIAAVTYVDDDGQCGGQTPCATTIQAAVTAAGAGDTITVYPGLYHENVTVGASKTGLTIEGVNPDAVFVDGNGGGAVFSLTGVTGVTLRRLTVRNANNGVQLTSAGVGGFDAPANVITLERVVVHSVTRAVSMDRTSTLRATRSTFVNPGGSNPLIQVTGSADPAIAATWLSRAAVPAAVNAGHRLLAAPVVDTNSGILAWLPFDEGSGSATANAAWDGTISGATWTSNSAPTTYDNDAALVFDGVDDSARSRGTGPNLNGASFSVAFWARRDSAGTADMAVAQGTGSNNNGLHIGFRNSNVFTCAFFGNDLDTVATYTDDDWHHWACTYHAGSNQRSIYRDGVQVAQATASTDYVGSGPILIGYRFGDTGYFHGALDDVRIYDRVLAPAELASGAYASLPGSDPNLQVYWAMNEGLGTTVHNFPDANANLVNMDPATAWTSASAPIDLSNPYALQFDGVNDTVQVTQTVPLLFNSFTVAFWARRTSVGSDGIVVSQGSANSDMGLHVGFRNTNAFTCAFWGNDLNTVATYTDTNWHHWACTYNAATNQRTIYRDGVQVAQAAATNDYVGLGPLYVGSRFGSAAFFGGAVDDVHVYNSTLSPVAVQTLANAFFAYQTGDNDSTTSGPDDAALYRYQSGPNSWQTMAAPPTVLANERPAVGAATDGYAYYLRSNNMGSANSFIEALVVDGPDVFIGGAFTQLTNPDGTTTNANGIARWDGRRWLALGGGVSGSLARVLALAVNGNNLYVGGAFTSVVQTGGASLTANYIATWRRDTRTWAAMGSGFNNYVESLAVSGSNVYAGGSFTDPTYFSVNNNIQQPDCRPSEYEVAIFEHDQYNSDPGDPGDWDGWCVKLGVSDYPTPQSWGNHNDEATSILVGAFVRAILYEDADFGGTSHTYNSHESNLANQGFNDEASSVRVQYKQSTHLHHVARWDGSAWQALSHGVGGRTALEVGALAVTPSGNLFAGGVFNHVTGSGFSNRSVMNIAYWNGSSWGQAGLGLNSRVRALAVGNNVLYAGGQFSTATYYTLAFPYTQEVPTSQVAQLNSLTPDPYTTWSALGSGVNSWVEDMLVDPSGGSPNPLYVAGWFSQAGGGTAKGIAVWNGSAWSEYGSGIQNPALGSNGVQALALDANGVTAGGQFTQAGPFAINAGNITRWANHYRYHTPTNTWSSWTSPDTSIEWSLTSPLAAGDNNGFLYALAGVGSFQFYRYDTAGNTWLARGSLPAGAVLGNNNAVVWAQGALYLLTGSGSAFYRYDPGTNSWTALANAPGTPGPGVGLAVGETGALYAQGGGTAFWRYDISANTWQTLAAPSVGGSAGAGGSLLGRSARLYATVGGNSTNFRNYGILGLSATKLTLDNVALVVPATAATATWTNLTSPTANNDFLMAISGSSWVAGAGTAWSPAAPQTLTVAQANFVDVPSNLYRVGEGTALGAGYHQYHAPVTVSASASPCDDCYTSIQAAIDSGAGQVLLEPGIYREPAYLVSGVQLLGSGAEATVLQPPVAVRLGEAAVDALVSGEGISSALIGRLTLDGGGTTNGIRLEDGAANVTVARNIVRNAGTALSFDGTGTNVEVVNNTLVDNDNGFAATNCADVDVRNTIFAAQGTALNYQTCAATELHQYNDYFANGQDYVIDGAPVNQPGAGEIAADPLFTNPLAQNYRPLPESPVIDVGNPSDPTPIGAGDRVDMGYVEVGAPSFNVSQSYCPTCFNDGLAWGVDAFDTIQDALDALAAHVAALGAPPDGQYTVGVADGTYQEALVMPSYANLVCQSHQVNIQTLGSIPTISVTDAVNVAIRGCFIAGSGGSNEVIRIAGSSPDVQIERNVMWTSGYAIDINGSSSANIQFNTITAFAAVSTSGNSWAVVENNIILTPEPDLESAQGMSFLLAASGDSKMSTDYNLLYIDPLYASGVFYYDGNINIGPNDATDVNPLLDPFTPAPLPNSPAVDTANPAAEVLPGGGRLPDRGAVELRSTPLALLFGRLAPSCTEGNSGVASVEVGIAQYSDYTTPLTATLPSTWVNAPLATPGQRASYWTTDVPPAGDGYYRVYTRAADVAGNAETDADDWFSGVIKVDGGAPAVSWVSAASTSEAALFLSASTTDEDAASGGFLVDSQFYPGQWVASTDPVRTFYAWVPVLDGSYQVTAQVTDRAGNTGSSSTQTVDVTTPAHVGTITSLLDSDATNNLNLVLKGKARYTGTNGTGQVFVSVNAGPPIAANVTDPAAILTAWDVPVTLPGSGPQTLQVTAGRTALGVTEAPVNTISILVDQTAPSLTIVQPAAGAVVTQTVTLAGTVADADSGVATVEFSVDGGATWQTTAVSGSNWNATWISPVEQPYVSYPLTVRAVDKAGNVTSSSRSFTVDLDAPTGFYPFTFNHPLDGHLDTFSTLQVDWLPVFDSSDLVTVTVAIDQNSTTTPSTVVAGTSYSRPLDTPGDWYVHLTARDAAGNSLASHHGPWHVGTFADTGVTCNARTQTIVLDGLIDVANQEWQAAELLDTDYRPDNPQSLYASWDGSGFYLGWQGAWWDLDGTLWAYLSTAGGGSTTPVAGGPQTLPFAAKYAIEIDGASTGTLWTYSGGWQAGSLQFAQGDSGGVEVRLPWDINSVGQVQLLAYALEDDTIWSAFPTTNHLSGQGWGGSYQWNGLCSTFDPGSGQPRADQATLSISSPQSQAAWYGSGDTLSYAVSVGNTRVTTMTNALVTLEATAGLGYQALQGATCSNCPPNGNTWQVLLDEIPGLTTRVFTVTGELAANLGTISVVTSTATLPAAIDPAVSFAHQVDGLAPVVAVGDDTPPFLKSGLHTLSGQADDSPGSGVALVEYRVGAGSWQPAVGTSVWQAEVNVAGSGTLNVDFRATDEAGNQSQIESVSFEIDDSAPLISAEVPVVITNTAQTIPGVTSDPVPGGSQVALVEMQTGAADQQWQPLPAPGDPDQAGEQSWSALWFLEVLDNQSRQVRFRATDLAGNVTTTGWQAALVDNVLPTIAATQLLTQVLVSDYVVGGPNPAPVLEGTAEDGSGINHMAAVVYVPDGQVYTETVTLNSGDWSYWPSFPNANVPLGRYFIRIGAVDSHGNAGLTQAFELLVTAPAVAALNAQLAFQAVSTIPANITVTMVLSPAVGALQVYTPTVSASGQVTLSTVPLGTYDVWVKHLNHLARRVADVVVPPGGLNGLDLGTQLGGDASDDNAVTGADYSLLAATYGLSQGNPGYDGRADFDFNQVITGIDFTILAGNYLQGGAAQPPAENGSESARPANTVHLRVVPLAQGVGLGQEFLVNLVAEAAAQPVDTVDAFVSFDPARLEVLEILPGVALPTVLASSFDNTAGRVTYAAGKQLGGVDAEGTFILATLRFQVRGTASLGTTSLAFILQPPLQDSNVFYRGESIRGGTTGGSVTIEPSTPCYDFDDDEKVTIVDIMLVAARFADPQVYLAAYDLNHDGVIDVFDVSMVAVGWGMQCGG